ILLSDLGLNSLIMREFAGTRHPSLLDLRSLLFVRVSSSVVAGTALAGATLFFIPSTDPWLLGTAGFGLIVLRSVAGGIENVVKARLYQTTYGVLTIGSSVAHVLLVYLVLDAGYGIDRVFMAMAGVELVKTVL